MTSPASTAPVLPASADADRRSRLLLPAQFVNCLGNGIQLTASALLVVRASHTTVSVGWLYIMVAVPQVLLSLFFGRLVDRHSRRLICVVCNLVSAAAATALPVCLLLGGRPDAGSYAANFLLAAVAALFVPAYNALIKERVAPVRLGAFNANFEMSTQAGLLLSTAAGGVLVQAIGVKPLFFFNAATFLVSAAFLVALGDHGTAAPGVVAATGAAVAPAVAAPVATDTEGAPDAAAVPPAPARTGAAGPDPRPAAPLFRLGLLYALGNIVITVSNALIVVLVIQTYGHGAGVLGVIDGLAGVGVFFAAMLFKRLAGRVPYLRTALLGYLGCAVLTAAHPFFGVTPVLVLLPAAAMSFGLARISARTLLMTAVGQDRAGRVFGATNAAGLGIALVAMVGISMLADHVGIKAAYLTLGGTVAVGAATAVWLLRGALPQDLRPGSGKR